MAEQMKAKIGQKYESDDGLRIVTVGLIFAVADEDGGDAYTPVGISFNVDEANQYLLDGTVGEETGSILALARGNLEDGD